jgi:SAM-dependent methyltransferase
MDNDQLAKSWSSENSVKYYLEHRDSIKELYESEKFFIESVLKSGRTVLDVGCAAGGFSKIVRQYNKNLEYAGVDIAPQMISLAKKRFPEDKFYLCSGEKLDFPDNSFDICICLGVLHMTERWKELLSEAWRVCRNTILFDLRVVSEEGICNADLSYQRLEFDMEWDGISKVPYVVVSLKETVDCIANMNPKIKSLSSYGYWAPVSKMTVSSYRDVCMSVFCIGKNNPVGIFDWRLPLKISKNFKQRIFD